MKPKPKARSSIDRSSIYQAPAAPSIVDIANLVSPPHLFKSVPSALCSRGEISFYLAGSPALAEIAKILGVYILKIGVTEKTPQERAKGLSATRYAGLWGRGEHLVELPGADAWRTFRLIRRADDVVASLDYVILQANGTATLRVPKTIERAHVDAAVTRIFEQRSLRKFLLSDAGRLRAAQAGIDPDSWFWTHYREPAPFGVRRPVQELFIIDPARDASMVLGALEALCTHFQRNTARASLTAVRG